MATAARQASGESGKMAEKNLPMGGDNSDDLPRTLRREREAREREAREREIRGQSFGPPDQAYTSPTPAGVYADDPQPAVVRRIEVPFVHLTMFFLKAAVAAIPALILLSVVFYATGKALQAYQPSLRLFEVIIRPVTSNAPTDPAAKMPPAPAKK